jgi:hypothetical protein
MRGRKSEPREQPTLPRRSRRMCILSQRWAITRVVVLKWRNGVSAPKRDFRKPVPVYFLKKRRTSSSEHFRFFQDEQELLGLLPAPSVIERVH